MKRFAGIGIFLSLFLSFVSCQSVRAADAYQVSADSSQIEILDEGTWLVPLMLYGNHGIMGFRISFSYDVEEVEILTVSRGTLTAAGNFMTNLAEKEAGGEIELLWNDTGEKKSDGSLCYLCVRIIAENPEIRLAYSQPDTFDETYQDVRLACGTIRLNNSGQHALAEQADPAGVDKSEDVQEMEQKQRDRAIAEYRTVQPEKRAEEDGIRKAYFHNLKKYDVKSYEELSGQEQEKFWADTKEYLLKGEGTKQENLEKTDIRARVERLGIAEKEYRRANQEEKNSGADIFRRFLLFGGSIAAVVLAFDFVMRVRRKRRFHKNGEDQ